MVQKVPVGTATVAGLGTSTAAYGLAIANYIAGDRSQDTYAALAVGTIALVTTLAGRFAQAVQHAKKTPTTTPLTTAVSGTSGVFVSGTTTTASRPSATVAFDAKAAGVAAVAKHSDALARLADEPGDPDALPDMLTAEPSSVEPDGDDREHAHE